MLFCLLIGWLAQKRKADWPAEVETADASKRTRGHTNSAAQRRRPLAPSTTCACDRCFLSNDSIFLTLRPEGTVCFTCMTPFAELWIKRSRTPSSLKCPGAGLLWNIWGQAAGFLIHSSLTSQSHNQLSWLQHDGYLVYWRLAGLQTCEWDLR